MENGAKKVQTSRGREVKKRKTRSGIGHRIIKREWEGGRKLRVKVKLGERMGGERMAAHGRKHQQYEMLRFQQ